MIWGLRIRDKSSKILKKNLKAIPFVIVGMAFFLMGCQGAVSIKKVVPEQAAEKKFDMAEAYRKNGQLDKAAESYQEYLEQFPLGEGSMTALHRMMEIYSETGQYEVAVKFLERVYRKYREASFRGEVLLFLGDNYRSLGNNLEAFKRWIEAKKSLTGHVQRQAEIKFRIEDLISRATIEELEEFAGYAEGSGFAPHIYKRLTTMFLAQKQLEKAKKAAMSLVRSTQEESWIALGRQLLTKIQEEMAVRFDAVGCLLPLSGPFSIYGEEVLHGIELGMGIFHRSDQDLNLELVIKDTKSSPKETLTALEDLVHKEKVMAIIGPLSSKTAVAAAEKGDKLGVPIITLAQKEGITKDKDMVFRNALTPSREIKRLLRTAMGEMGIKRFGILYPDNSYGRFFMNLFWDRLEEMGGTVSAVESYKPDETDFAEQIKKMTGLYYPRPYSKIKELRDVRTPEEEESEIYPEEPEPIIDFDAIFIPDNFQTVAMIAPQLVYYDVLDVLLMGTSLWQSPRLIEMAGDYVQGAIFPSGFFERSGEPGIGNFLAEYEENFGSMPGILAATGYDTIRLLENVMAWPNIRIRRDLHDALLEYNGFEGVTGNIFFDSQKEVGKEPLLLTVYGSHMTLYN